MANASERASGENSSAQVQLVFDPCLTVDPDWIYAEYFVAQQESTLNEGEWVGITRDYLDAPVVPVPASVWLFSSAIGLVGWMKRRA